jgi:hypothetical protein
MEEAFTMRAIKIIYEGTDIYPDVSVNACFHDMYAEKRGDELLLRLNDTRELWDIWSPKADDTIAIEDGTATTGKMYVESVVPQNGLVTLRAFSIPQSSKNKTNKSWEQIRFIQIAEEIAERHGLGFEQYGVTDQIYDYVAQSNIQDFAFLQQRCVLEGAAFLVYDGKLVIYNEQYLEGQAALDTIEVGAADNFEYQNDAVNAYGTAEAVNGGLTGTYTAANGSSKTLRKVIPVQMRDQSEADRFAHGLLRNTNKGMTTGTIWAPIARNYAAGSVVNISTQGEGSWDGPAFLTHVRHDYLRERSKLFFRRPLEGY